MSDVWREVSAENPPDWVTGVTPDGGWMTPQPSWKTKVIPAGWVTLTRAPGSVYITPVGGWIMGRFVAKYFDLTEMGPGMFCLASPPDGDPKKIVLLYAIRNHKDSRAAIRFDGGFLDDPDHPDDPNGYSILHFDLDRPRGRLSQHLKMTTEDGIEWLLTDSSRAVAWFRPCQTKKPPFMLGTYTDEVGEDTPQDMVQIHNGPMSQASALVCTVGRPHVVKEDAEFPHNRITWCGARLEVNSPSFQSKEHALDAVDKKTNVLPCLACLTKIKETVK